MAESGSTRARGSSDIEADIDTIRREFAELKQSITELVRKEAGALEQEGRARIKAARDQGSKLASDAANQLSGQVHGLEDQIRARPLSFVLGAAAVGFVLSLLIRRS